MAKHYHKKSKQKFDVKVPSASIVVYVGFQIAKIFHINMTILSPKLISLVHVISTEPLKVDTLTYTKGLLQV